MTPSEAIDALDRALNENGSAFKIIRRPAGGAGIDWGVKGFMRKLTPSEMTDGIGQGARNLVLSPTSLIGSPFELDGPKRGDFLLSQERKLAVEAVEAVLLADVVVRFNLTVAG